MNPPQNIGHHASSLKWTAHPIVDRVIPPLSLEEQQRWVKAPGGFDRALEYWNRHEAMIKDAAEDPLHRGFELPFWQDLREFMARKDELYALGGNGPGKTEIGGKLVVEKLCELRGAKVLCVARGDGDSKQLQQPAVYKYLPPGVRVMNERAGARRRSVTAKINYSQAGGFTEGTFVLPNRSQCWFKTVEQYQRDKTAFEGPEYDLVWIDEPAPIALVDTLQYRVGKRGGKFFFTFTAVEGFDAVCNRILTGARLLVSLPMNFQWTPAGVGNVTAVTGKATPGVPAAYRERGACDPSIVVPELRLDEEQVKGCPPGHMPYLMQPLDAKQGVIFLWTHWNVFLPRSKQNPAIPDVFNKCRGKSKGVVRTRCFGWAEKIAGCQFPQFTPSVHVIPNEKVPVEGTDYMAADPQTARSYFLLWARVDRQGRVFIFDESPRLEEGAWVDDDGNKGDGQRVFAGIGSKEYKRLIRRREHEHGQPAMKRKGDPRAFATAAASEQGGETLFELFLREGDDAETAPMPFAPAKVRATILLDLEKVNDLLYYDSAVPLSAENQPRLYVAERCQNLIRCMLSWSPDQGSDSPYKDPVDTLRYLLDEQLYYVDPGIPEVVGGRGW